MRVFVRFLFYFVSSITLSSIDGLYLEELRPILVQSENFIRDSVKWMATNRTVRKFPEYFKFGAATAAYQIEGAWNEEGKGDSAWDTLCHQHPELIADRSSGDIGPDSYHLYKNDVAALKEVGFHFYRFSISWARILPDGDLSSLNHKGIDYYNRLIDELIKNDIIPVVTMFHYDIPQYLQNLGGFLNPLIVRYFEIYAGILYSHFGDRVKYWITFNEPFDLCVDGYGTGKSAPLIYAPGIGEYLCAHYLLISHARAYHLYKDNYQKDQSGYISITLNGRFFYPNSNSTSTDVVDRALQYRLGWLSHPIFSQAGGYPPMMVEEIAENSLKEGRSMSRLPVMDERLREYIRGSADFFAYNYYTSRLVELNTSAYDTSTNPSWGKDAKLITTIDPKWKRAKSTWIFSVPEGLHDILVWIKNEYKNPSLLITENGWSDDGQLDDYGRVDYLKQHLDAVLRAVVNDKCNVFGYTAWSIIDNFEWLQGYTEKFGLYQVNMSSPNKERIPKLSSRVMSKIIKTRMLP